MRKFSETFMKLPVRIYKLEDVEKYFKEKDVPGLGEDEELNYAIGYVRVAPYDIKEWHDGFTSSRDIEDIKADGFDTTRVVTATGESYDCIWSRDKFEARLDKFMEDLEKEIMLETEKDKL